MVEDFLAAYGALQRVCSLTIKPEWSKAYDRVCTWAGGFGQRCLVDWVMSAVAVDISFR